MNLCGIEIPFPNILFIPSSPKAKTAPVANAGKAFFLLLQKEVPLHPEMPKT